MSRSGFRRFRSPSPQTEVSLETRIGGQWLNRIGIVAVLVGLSYFLKLAIENDWIGPGTRVAIGLVAGIGLILWSERFRARAFLAFAYSLKAIGIGALYLSLWAAFQFYHLVSAPVAFFAMMLVTASSAAMSLTQNSELLAAFALVGGFLTPVLVSTNQNHEVALFSYVALLDLGTVWVVAMRGWQRLLLGSFVGTTLLFAAWASSYYDGVAARHDVGLRQLLLSALRRSTIPGTQVRHGTRYPNVLVALALFSASLLFRSHLLDAVPALPLGSGLAHGGGCSPILRPHPGVANDGKEAPIHSSDRYILPWVSAFSPLPSRSSWRATGTRWAGSSKAERCSGQRIAADVCCCAFSARVHFCSASSG